MPRGKGLSDEVKTIIDSSYKVFKDESDPWKKIFNCYLKAYPDVTLKQVSDYGCKNIGKGRRKKRAASASADKVDVEEAIEVLSDVSPPRRKKRKSGNLEADVIEVEDYKTQQRRAHDSFLKTILDLVGKGPPPIFYRANEECLSKPGTIDGLTVAIARADHTQVNVKVYHEIKCVHVQVKYFTMSLNDMEDVARRNLNMARRLNEIRKFNNPEKTTFEYAIKIPDEYVTHGHEICAEPTIRFICIFFPKQMDKSYGCSKGEFDGELSMDKGRSKKKIPTIDAKGKVFKPKENNGIKLEMFIFDAFNYAKNMKCFIVDRFGEFSPVKNPPGIGKLAAPDVARADVNRYHLSLLSKAGLSLPKAVSEKLDIAESNFKPSLLAQTAVKSVKAGVPMLVYVHGEKINRDGVMESWCPDCRVASKILFEELKEREAKGKGYILITLPVARAGYKGNASHMYRTNPDMKIEGVPTLFLWTTKGPIAQRTLGEAGCQSPEKVKNFLDYSYAISARNVEIPAKLSYDGEGLESAVADSLKLADPLAQWCSPGVQ
ncbi:hypothetical protein AAMO2058_000937000 [Amorphochlora amoebiformis]